MAVKQLFYKQTSNVAVNRSNSDLDYVAGQIRNEHLPNNSENILTGSSLQDTFGYRSIQIDYRQTLSLGEFISNYRYRIVLPEELIAVTETDLWECLQNISHYRYRFSPKFQLISITDTDFRPKQMNSVMIAAATVTCIAAAWILQDLPRLCKFYHPDPMLKG